VQFQNQCDPKKWVLMSRLPRNRAERRNSVGNRGVRSGCWKKAKEKEERTCKSCVVATARTNFLSASVTTKEFISVIKNTIEEKVA
jgi:hypothetical protein